MRFLLAGMLGAATLAAGGAALAQSAEAPFLQTFAGTFTGSGTVTENVGGSSRNLDCRFTSVPQGGALSFDGTCRAVIVFTTDLHITLQAGAGGRYTGQYRDGTGTTATLAGTRQGSTFSLSFTQTDENHPPARLTINAAASKLDVRLQRAAGDKGRNVSLSLAKS